LPETESSVLKGQLTKLGLHSIAATFEAEADRAAKSETTFTAYLGRLVELELADKADRSINARIARARFPVLRTLEQFDFGFQPSLSAARVRELASLAFLDQAVNVLFVGGPGVGKIASRYRPGSARLFCASQRTVHPRAGAAGPAGGSRGLAHPRQDA
jgi:DNA replication protein DnaC